MQNSIEELTERISKRREQISKYRNQIKQVENLNLNDMITLRTMKLRQMFPDTKIKDTHLTYMNDYTTRFPDEPYPNLEKPTPHFRKWIKKQRYICKDCLEAISEGEFESVGNLCVKCEQGYYEENY